MPSPPPRSPVSSTACASATEGEGAGRGAGHPSEGSTETGGSPRLAASFVTLVAIWSTTPLAIQWSADGEVSFVAGLGARMLVGFLVLAALHLWLRRPLPVNGAALHAYVASGFGIYGAMMLVYWGAQFIPSGWIALLGGLMPLTTGLLAAAFLGERAFSPPRLLGMLLGLTGLLVMFGAGDDFGPMAIWGLLAAAGSNTMHGVSSVWLKRIGHRLPVLTLVTGGIGITLPFYFLSWWLHDGGVLPASLHWRTLISILYLGLFGSVFGFLLFYHLLRHLEASRTALVSLVTPVSALALGILANNEPFTWQVAGGTCLILSGLLAYERGRPILWLWNGTRALRATTWPLRTGD
jgi:drug/metabolite transporter (DMT)-like permease